VNISRKREVERSDTGEFEIGEGVTCEQPDVDEVGDCSKKQEQNDSKIYCYYKTRGERRAILGDKRGRTSTTM